MIVEDNVTKAGLKQQHMVIWKEQASVLANLTSADGIVGLVRLGAT